MPAPSRDGFLGSWIEPGRKRRLSRLCAATGLYRLLALDHRLTHPIAGLDDIGYWIAFAARHQFGGVILNPGMAERFCVPPNLGLIVQTVGLPNLAQSPTSRVSTCDIETAVKLGADAISVQLLFSDHPGFPESFRICSEAKCAAHAHGLPVLCMVNYPTASPPTSDDLCRAVCACSEVGFDLIKVPRPADWDRDDNIAVVAKVLSGASPVLLAGGDYAEDFRAKVRVARTAGFSGVCVGRNIFQAGNPDEIVDGMMAECAR